MTQQYGRERGAATATGNPRDLSQGVCGAEAARCAGGELPRARTLGRGSRGLYVPFLVLAVFTWPFSLSFFFKVYFLAVPHSMWDLHSLTRDQPLTPCSGSKEPFFFFHLTIYFWLHWVLITTCGLSLAAESGGCSPMQLLGLLFLGPWALGHSGSGRCGSRAPGLRLNSRGAQA